MTDKVAQAIAEISAKLDKIEAMVAELTGKGAEAQAVATESEVVQVTDPVIQIAELWLAAIEPVLLSELAPKAAKKVDPEYLQKVESHYYYRNWDIDEYNTYQRRRRAMLGVMEDAEMRLDDMLDNCAGDRKRTFACLEAAHYVRETRKALEALRAAA